MMICFAFGLIMGALVTYFVCIRSVEKYQRICERMIKLNKEMHATNCNMLIDMVNYSPNAIEDPIVKLN